MSRRRVLGSFWPGRLWAVSNLGVIALVGGFLWPWRNISYFSAGRISDGVLDLPGGRAYGIVVAAFLIAAVCGGTHGHRIRPVLLAMGLGLAGYSAFWLLGGLALDLDSGFSLAHPTFGAGLLLSFLGSLLALRSVATSGRRTPTRPVRDLGADVILPDDTEDGSSGLASCDEFTERLQGLSRGGARETVPIVVVRVDGLEDIRSRYGSPVADQISVALAHRLRAQLRQGDTAVSLVPGEMFILLSGQASERNAKVVVRRLEGVLDTPVPSMKNRYDKLVKVTVEIARARVTNGRLQVVVNGDCLLDAPVAPSAGSSPAISGPA